MFVNEMFQHFTSPLILHPIGGVMFTKSPKKLTVHHTEENGVVWKTLSDCVLRDILFNHNSIVVWSKFPPQLCTTKGVANKSLIHTTTTTDWLDCYK